MTSHCEYCGKRGPRDYSSHTTTEWVNPRQEVDPTNTVDRRVYTTERSRPRFHWVYDEIKTPYEGNLKVVRENGGTATLWDGESYKVKYGNFCTLRCALAYANAEVARRAIRKGEVL